jgi:alpha-mannosidase
VNLADMSGGLALNAYRYVPGANPKDAQTNGVPKITIKESGPVVASMLVESDAPGGNKLTREIRVMNGVDHVDIVNTLDKKAIRTKEGVHFGFAFNVPNGVVRMDVPFAVVRPEQDQMKGACKNWFTVQRWVDISNDQYGVTWATIDAPLVEVGAITADVTGGIPWLEHIAPSQTIFSYVMNNYWHTNYKADQDGPTVFRYAIRPHKAYRTEDATRFGIECSQPLVASLARGEVPTQPRLRIDNSAVVVSALKPSDDGKAWIIRLFNASEQAGKATLTWAAPAPKAMFLSDIAERPLSAITGPIDVPPYGMVTVRAELP